MTLHSGIKLHVYDITQVINIYEQFNDLCDEYCNDIVELFNDLSTEHRSDIFALEEIIDNVIKEYDLLYIMTYNELYNVYNETPIDTNKACIYSSFMNLFPSQHKDNYKIAFKKFRWW